MNLRLQKELLSEANCNSQLPVKGRCQGWDQLSNVGIFSQGKGRVLLLLPEAPQLFDLMFVGIIMGTFR